MSKRPAKRIAVLTVLAGCVLVATAAAASGKLDPGFGNGGVVVTSTAPGTGGDFQNGLAVQPDGRIVVGGSSDMGAAAGGQQWRVSRYTRQGELDGSFGTGGTVTTSMSSAGDFDEHVWSLTLDGDGKVVAAGDAVTAAGGFDVAVARYDPDGSLDTSFGTGGKLTTAIGPGARRDRAHRVAALSDGKILVAGFADMGPGAGRRNLMLARYNHDGSLDASFGLGGIVITAAAPGDNFDIVTTDGLAIDAQGRIVVAGWADLGAGAGGADALVARYHADGSLDSSFGSGGIVTTPLADGDNFDAFVSVKVDEAGKIVAGGDADSGSFIFDIGLARFNADGTPDGTFGSGGKVITARAGDEDLEMLAIQPSGKILAGGSTAPTEILVDSDFMVARYNPNGSLDSSFGGGGIVTTNTAAGTGSDEIYGIALQSEPKLVVSGECDQAATGRDVCLARYKVGEDD